MNAYPQRIVCLTAETTETLYLLGEQRRIVGISGFTARPPQARREKPRVSAFTSARVDRIEALQPDPGLGSREFQPAILATPAARGLAVHLFDQRSIAGILVMLRSLGGMVGCEANANDLAAGLAWRVEAIRAANSQSDVRPRLYFEEW